MDKIYLAKEVGWDGHRILSAHSTYEGAQKAADSDKLFEQRDYEDHVRRDPRFWKDHPFPQGRVWTVTEMELKD